MKIYFVTSNKSKFREARSLLAGIELFRADFDVPEIQSVSLEEVSMDKAKKAYAKLRKPVVVEDTGLFIKELGGFPGALWKWMFVCMGREGTVRMASRFKDRSAYSQTVVCICNGKRIKMFEGKCLGSIAEKARGESEFGFDPIFIPKGYNRTFAEMSEEEKNSILHRGKAFRKLKAYLVSHSKA